MVSKFSTELLVENFDDLRAFYLEILQDVKLLVNGNFITTISNSHNLLTLRTPTPFSDEKTEKSTINLLIPATNINEVHELLKSHNLKIEQIERDKQNLIILISSYDLEGNELIIQSVHVPCETEHSDDLNKTKALFF